MRAADHFFAPPGTPYDPGAVNSYTNPEPFTIVSANNFISNHVGEANVHLVSGTNDYVLDTWKLPACQTVRLLGTNALGAPAGTRPVLKYAVPTAPDPNQPAQPSHLFNGPSWGTWLISAKSVSTRFEAHNLILDGNWSAWAATNPAASPTYVSGFALGALHARAQQGEIRNVHVRNCGANGITPSPHWKSSGRECFPLFLHATDYGYGLGTGIPAWVVEDCEVSDFHSLHGGYATLIMPMVDTRTSQLNPDDYPDHRPFVVRRCQIRGNRHTIAFGSAGYGGNSPPAAGVIYSDNVVLNAWRGLNHDTGEMHNFDYTNNILLDVGMLGNIGGSGWGASGFVNYTVSGNAIRLRGVPLNQNYRSFEWRTNTIGTFTAIMPVSDPTLAIGRFETGYCVGLNLAGTDAIVFSDNRFTTRPLADFYEPDPGQGTSTTARWTPVYRPAKSLTSLRANNQLGSISTNGNALSSVAMDFTGLNALTVVTNGEPDALPAIVNPPTGFTPGGWPGRVIMEFLGKELQRVYEVQISRPLLSSNLVTVQARLVYHPAAASGLTETGSAHPHPFPDDALHLLVPDGPNAGEFDNSPNWNGDVATFTYPGLVNSGGMAPGRDRIVVYVDQGAGFTPDDTARAETELLQGATVRFERTPDVADDRRLNAGTLRLASSSSNGVTVRVLPLTIGVTRPALPGNDYDLKTLGGTLLNLNSDGCWELPIPSGSTEASFRVVPRNNSTRHLAEYEAAWFRIQTNASYAIAPPKSGATATADGQVAVTLWDGAKYRIRPLDDYYYFSCSGSRSAATSGGGLAPASEVPLVSPEATVQLLAEVVAGTRPATDPTLQALARRGLLPEKTVRELGILPQVPAPTPPRERRLTRLPDTGLEETLRAEWQARETLGLNTPPPSASQSSTTPTLDPAGFAVQSSYQYYLPASYLLAFGLNQTNTWHAAGYSHYYNNYYSCLPQEFQLGGYWVDSTLWNMVEVNDPWSGWAEMLAVADDGVSVGAQLSGYYYRPVRTLNGWTTSLPDLGYGGEALSIGPLGQQIAGWCREYASGYRYRAIRWDQSGGTWSLVRLGDFDGDTSPGSPISAYAYGLNDSGVAVGKCQTNSIPTNLVYRAFRTGANQVLSPSAGLEVITPPAGASTNTSAFISSANAISPAGHAVGSSTTYYQRDTGWQQETRATIWWPGETEARDLRTIELTLPRLQAPGHSEALGIAANPTGVTVVGTGWITPTGYARAFKMEIAYAPGNQDKTAAYAKMLDLNDPHLSWSDQSGITLTSAEAVNDAGVIVANGYWTWRPTWMWGFVLEPQAVATE